MGSGQSRRKRTHKANSPSVCGLQAREGENGVQASTEAMPQSASPAVAETDTGTKQGKGGFMYNFKDRLVDWANTKGAWTHILVAAGIALLFAAIILAAAMPSKVAVNANAVDIGELRDAIGVISNGLGVKASKADLDGVNDALGEQAGDISVLVSRVGNAEGRLNTVEDGLANLPGNSFEAHLTGVFGNYTLSIMSNEAGNFTANVHLVYSPSVGNATGYSEALNDFYAGINWTALVPAYMCLVTFNGTAWGVSEVWWNICTFSLIANTEKTIAVTCAGLNSTWEPSFAYVEVYRI